MLFFFGRLLVAGCKEKENLWLKLNWAAVVIKIGGLSLCWNVLRNCEV
jgi:hypothetical protein